MPKATNSVNWPPKEKGFRPAPRPTSVKIGHLEFAIHWISDDKWTTPNGNDPDLQGIFLANQGRINIRVQSDIHEQVMRETLWHEIMHGCWWFMGFQTSLSGGPLQKPAEETEEDIVTRLTHCTIMVIQDNPDVLAYLGAQLFSVKARSL